MERRNFLKTGYTGISCLCGFGLVSVASAKPAEESNLHTQWIQSILTNLNDKTTTETQRVVIKSTSQIHFQQLGMHNVLAPYIGNLPEFLKFLTNTWGWVIEHNTNNKSITANENKNECVCPLFDNSPLGYEAICYCSEGFAEQMFSMVIQHKVGHRLPPPFEEVTTPAYIQLITRALLHNRITKAPSAQIKIEYKLVLTGNLYTINIRYYNNKSKKCLLLHSKGSFSQGKFLPPDFE